MIYHQSNVFSKIFQILFIVGSTFHFSSRSASTILGGVSRYLSMHLKTEEEFSSISCSILFKIRDSSLLPSSHNCFDCENSFHPSGASHELFSFLSSKAHHFRRIIHSQLSALILEILPVIHPFTSFIFNSYGGSFKNSLPLLLY